jgi:hypothetical protein
MVVIPVLIDTGVSIDCLGGREALAAVIARGAPKGSATRRPVALVGEVPFRLRPVIDLLNIDGIVVVVPLPRAPVALAERLKSRSSRRTTKLALRSLVTRRRPAERGSANGASFGSVEARWAVKIRSRWEWGSTASKRRRPRGKDRRLVNILVLHLDRMIVLVELIDIGVEVAGDGHIEALAFIIARGAPNGSATRRPVALLIRTQVRDHRARAFKERARLLPRHRRRVHILVLDVNGVIILAPFIHIAVGVDVWGDASNSVTIIVARRAPQNSGPTGLRQEWQSSITRRAKLSCLLSVLAGIPSLQLLRVPLTGPSNWAWAAAASSARGIPPTKRPFIVANVEPGII